MPTYVQNLLTSGVVQIPALGMTLQSASATLPVAKGSVARIHPRVDINGEPVRSQLRLLKNRGVIRLLSEEEYSALNAPASSPPAPKPAPAPPAAPAKVDDAPTPPPEPPAAKKEEVPEESPREETPPETPDDDGEDEYLKTADELSSLSKKKIVSYIRDVGLEDEFDLRRTKESILEEYGEWLDSQD